MTSGGKRFPDFTKSWEEPEVMKIRRLLPLVSLVIGLLPPVAFISRLRRPPPTEKVATLAPLIEDHYALRFAPSLTTGPLFVQLLRVAAAAQPLAALSGSKGP